MSVPEPPIHPAGPFTPEPRHEPAAIRAAIDSLEAAPRILRTATIGLPPLGFDLPYRNWSVRQIVHHLADSHLNAFVRVKLTLTEDRPTVKPYDESLWAATVDARDADPELSLRIFESVHARLVMLLRSLPLEAFGREYFHPERNSIFPLWHLVDLYAWHARHHTAQIRWVREHRLERPPA